MSVDRKNQIVLGSFAESLNDKAWQNVSASTVIISTYEVLFLLEL